jgi:hypothetical protein
MTTAQKIIDPAEVSSIKQELSREYARQSGRPGPTPPGRKRLRALRQLQALPLADLRSAVS